MTREVKYDLEERLIDISVTISKITERLPNTRLGNYLSDQLLSSGCSPALNHGEAQAAESRNNYIHKMKLILKELRESFIYLKIIERRELYDLISIAAAKDNAISVSQFFKSIETAKKNNLNQY